MVDYCVGLIIGGAGVAIFAGGGWGVVLGYAIGSAILLTVEALARR